MKNNVYDSKDFEVLSSNHYYEMQDKIERDEALLRQALEALGFANPMSSAGMSICALAKEALRERLGGKHETD